MLAELEEIRVFSAPSPNITTLRDLSGIPGVILWE
jgi:hypothetical protein